MGPSGKLMVVRSWRFRGLGGTPEPPSLAWSASNRREGGVGDRGSGKVAASQKAHFSWGRKNHSLEGQGTGRSPVEGTEEWLLERGGPLGPLWGAPLRLWISESPPSREVLLFLTSGSQGCTRG